MRAYIQGRGVNLTFRPPNRAPVRALQSFDIDIAEGEFLSIVGPSGCGKSTFLNVLLGLIRRLIKGTVNIYDRHLTVEEIRDRSVAEAPDE